MLLGSDDDQGKGEGFFPSRLLVSHAVCACDIQHVWKFILFSLIRQSALTFCVYYTTRKADSTIMSLGSGHKIYNTIHRLTLVIKCCLDSLYVQEYALGMPTACCCGYSDMHCIVVLGIGRSNNVWHKNPKDHLSDNQKSKDPMYTQEWRTKFLHL
ncbi:hypothetical protein ACJX0J_013638, partial [Zea mays]